MVVSLFFIGGKSPDIKGLKKGGCYEREKQRDKGKQEGATEKPQREEKDEEGEEEQVGVEEALGGENKRSQRASSYAVLSAKEDRWRKEHSVELKAESSRLKAQCLQTL